MLQARLVALALLVSFAPIAVPVPAAAQTDDPTTKAARARFQEGVDFYDKGQYENARAAFLQAYALKKHPAVLLNLAQSSLRSNRPLEASRYFQQFLRESQGLSAAQRETANAGLTEARTRLGRVEIVGPPNTEITLDGERVGMTPLADQVDVEPGSHVVKGRLPEGKEEQQSVSVAAGQRTTARFGAAAQPVPVVVPVATTPAPVMPEPQPTTEPQGAPAATVPVDLAQPRGPGLLSPPRTMVPVWIGLVIGVGGAATAVAFAVAKGSAQENARSVETAIRQNGGGTGTCSSSDASVQARFGKACTVLADNRALVDTDALLANIGIAVGAAGLATAVGWYLFAPKRDAAPKTGFRSITPAPLAGPGGATGLTLQGTF